VGVCGCVCVCVCVCVCRWSGAETSDGNEVGSIVYVCGWVWVYVCLCVCVCLGEVVQRRVMGRKLAFATVRLLDGTLLEVCDCDMTHVCV